MKEALSDVRINYFSLWLSDKNLGRVLIDIGQAPTYAIYGFLAHIFNWDYELIQRLVHFFPIVFVAPIAIYLLLRLFINNHFAILIGIFTFIYNTYALILNTGHLTLAAAYSISPLVLYFYIRLLHAKAKKVPLIIGTSLSLFVVTAYEPRLSIIIVFILVLYFLFYILLNKLNKKQILNKTLLSLYSGVLFLVLNFYWIWGLFNTSLKSNNNILDRGLFGNEFFQLPNALTLYHSFWNGQAPVAFVINDVPFYFWILPLIVVLGVAINKRNKNILFFALLSIIGVFLSKQIDQPLGITYAWLFENVPGFSAFREASKFYIIVAIAFSVLVAACINQLSKIGQSAKIKFLKFSIFIGLGSLFLINVAPFITGTIGTTFKPKVIPEDYNIYNQFINDKEESFRVLWLPRDSRWATFSNKHQKLSMLDVYNNLTFNYEKTEPDNVLFDRKVFSLFNNEYIKDFLNKSSIRYLVIPPRDIENEDDFFIHYGNDRHKYIEYFNNIDWLTRLDIGTEELIIYENSNYSKYFNTSTELVALTGLSGLDNLYKFSTDLFNTSEFNFYHKEPTENSYNALIEDIFKSINYENIIDNSISLNKTLDKSNNSYLYIGNENYEHEFRISNNILFIESLNNNLLSINDEIVNESMQKQQSLRLDNKDYSFSIGNSLNRIDKNSSSLRKIGATKEEVAIYSNSTNNLLKNGSFENGLWNLEVEDCNNYDHMGDLSMKIESEIIKDKRHSLKFSSYNHTACITSEEINVIPGSEYSISYDYYLNNGQRAGYEILFEDGTSISEDQLNGMNKWYQVYNKFKVPENNNKLRVRLFGYQDDKRKLTADTYYDNVQVILLNKEIVIAEKRVNNYTKLPILDSKDISISIKNEDYNFLNIIENPSFEKGLWQEKVGDCNAHDNNPKLSMNLSNDQRSEGNNSLSLSATRHIACTNAGKIAVKEGSRYLFSFDYMSPNAKNAGYHISFNDPKGTVINERIKIGSVNKWNNFTKYITVPFGADSLIFNVYSYSEEYGVVENINYYDNFYLIETPNFVDEYYFTSVNNSLLKQPSSISFDTSINSQTKKYLVIKGASHPFYLNMSESYHTQWRLNLDDERVNGTLNSWIPWVTPISVDNSRHYKLNDFLNSWLVDPQNLCNTSSSACKKNDDGSYDIKLVAEFMPQRHLYIGLIVSGISFVITIVYIFNYYFTHKKKNEVSL